MIIYFKKSFRKLTNIIFANYFVPFFIGVILLLIGIIVSQRSDHITINIIGEFCRVVGLSLSMSIIIAYFIDKQKYFIFFKRLFIDFLYQREVIQACNFDNTIKEKILENVIMPLETDKQSERVNSFNKEYMNIIINSALVAEKRSVRDNYKVHYDVSMSKGKVVINATHRYTLYKNRVGDFEPIDVKLDRESGGSLIENIKIKGQGSNKVETLVINERKVVHELKDYRQYDSLIITVKIVEYGYDHWILSKFQTSQSIYSIDLNINCIDQLKVKDHFLFDETQFSINNHGNIFSLEAREWFVEGLGIAVIIGLE